MSTVILTVYDQSGNGYVLDLYGQDTISMNFNFNNITTLESGEVYSQEFRIPATQNNCSIFGLQSDFNIVSNNDIKRKFRAELTVDTIPVANGFVQFKKSYIKYNKMSDFSIVFFGDAVDLGTNLKDLDFSVLDYSDLEHPVNFTNCKEVNDGGTIGGNDYSDHKLLWAMIDRGQQFMSYPSSFDGVYVDAPYDFGSGPTAFFQPENIISPEDLTPCIKHSYLIDKINAYLASQSKRVIQLSTAIQSELDKMCMPFIGQDGGIKYHDNGANNIQFKANQTADETLSWSLLGGGVYIAPTLGSYNEQIDIGSNFSALTNEYTIPQNGYYQFSFRGTVRAQNGSFLTVPYKTVVPGFLVNGTTFVAGWNNNISGTINTGGPVLGSGTADYPIEARLNTYAINTVGVGGDEAIGFTTYTTQVAQVQNGELVVTPFNNSPGVTGWNSRWFTVGDTIQPCFAAYGDPTNGGAIDIICQCTSFDFQKVQIAVSTDFSAAQMAPQNYQLLDFLRDIMKLTNAVAIPNYSNYGVIDIMTMNEYLAGGGIVDWTTKLDENAEMTVIPSSEYQTRKQRFTYSEGSDIANQTYKAVGRLYGTLDLYDTESDFTVGENVTQLEACPTPNQMLNGHATWHLPKFVDADYQWTSPGARFLYFNFDTLFHINPEGGVIVGGPDGMDVPFVGQYDQLLPDLSSNDLNFAQEIPLHPIISAPANTAYLKYYNNYLQELYSAESKVLTAQFNLDVTDILNLQFNDSVFLFNSYWRVLSVDGYNMGMNQSTSVTLIKKLSGVDLPNVCTDTAIAIEKDGSVDWLNGGNQICCEQIGYYWDAGLSKCYRSQNQGGIKPRPTSPLSSVKGGFDSLFNNATIVKDPSATNTIAVGDKLTVTGEAKNSIVGGSDLLVQNRGIWYGGGNDLYLKNQSATGIMTWFGKGMFFSITQENYVGSFLTLPNSVYTAIVTINVSELDFTHPPGISIVSHYSIVTHSMINNVGGAATGDIPHNLIIDSDPYSIGPFELLWRQDLTNTSIINLYIKNLNGSYPSPELYFTAQVNVTQLGTE